MAKMQLVIEIVEIDDNEYIGIKEYPNNITSYLVTIHLYDMVRNGTPLPKGHGRLIILSEDAVKREQTPLSFSCQNWISEVGLSNATVAIIEADKEEEE